MDNEREEAQDRLEDLMPVREGAILLLGCGALSALVVVGFGVFVLYLIGLFTK